MQNLLNIIIEYLFKGGLLTAFNTYLLPTMRQYITTYMYQLAFQMVILGALLFVIDWVLPRFLPQFAQEQPMEQLE